MTAQTPPAAGAGQPELSCSFCGKSRLEVRKLISGPNIYICNECIELCVELVAEDATKALTEALAQDPRELLAVLDARVVGGLGAKRALSAAVRQHLLRHRDPAAPLRPPHVLLVGPTGCGKTSLGAALCASLPVPTHHADLSRLTESGYVGEDVENLAQALVNAAKGDVDQAERGVLFLDGLEKIRAQAPSVSAPRDIGGAGVQRELLRLLDGLPMELPLASRRHPGSVTTPFKASGLLVVAAVRLDAGVDPSDRELRQALEAMGLFPELVARFDRIVPFERLDEAALMSVLVGPRGLIAGAQAAVRALGGTLEYTPGALQLIALAAASSPHGAWTLAPPIQRHLEEVFSSAAPARPWRVDESLVRELVDGRAAPPARGPYR